MAGRPYASEIRSADWEPAAYGISALEEGPKSQASPGLSQQARDVRNENPNVARWPSVPAEVLHIRPRDYFASDTMLQFLAGHDGLRG